MLSKLIRGRNRLPSHRRLHSVSQWSRTGSSPSLRLSEEVKQALAENKPIVALETTIYTHGFPYPQNLELARHLEAVVRQNNAVPATIGILDGLPMVGMNDVELNRLVETPGARKISRRDLGHAIGSKLFGPGIHGGTTIAGTMILASLAGIKVFATGGLGGVHAGGENSLDISADLTELGRPRQSPVAVIASGCKGFLDIPRTLEFLETQGVAVATFADGRTGAIDFPAFWSRDSGSKSPLIIQNELEAAAMIHAHFETSIDSSIFLANPVPVDAEIPLREMASIIQKAIDLAHEAGATGSSNTPFVLDAIKTLTNGQSVVANRALVESNVIRGAKVAVRLKELEELPKT